MPGTGPGGGKAANSRRRVSAALRGKDCVIYWKGGAENLNKDVNQSRKSLWNRAVEYGTGNLCRDCRFSLVLYNYVIHKNHTV